jgi:uncharacterized membrane protein YsdA (DUF1294 family)
MFEAFVFYFLAINAAAFGALALDKRAAERRAWRVPERRLLTLAAFGGSAGALLGQQLLRHKSRKEPFRTSLRVVAAMHVALLGYVAYRLM